MNVLVPFLVGLGLLALGRPARAAASLPDPAPAAVPLSLEPFAQVDLEHPEGFRRELSLRLIGLLQEAEFRHLLASRLSPEATGVGLDRLVRDWAETWPSPEHRRTAALFAELSQDLRRRMGLGADCRSILRLDLVWPPDGPRHLDWSRILFAVRPRPSALGPAEVEAYDLQGHPWPLASQVRPEVPVLMAGIDRRAVGRAGLEQVNRGLQAAGYAARHQPMDPTLPIPCAKLAAVRVAADLEPWWKDGLEIYALVSGIDPVQDQPNLRLIDLPYLQHDATDYFPNQILLFWSDYRFQAANLQFWDHGDATDYQALLAALLKGVEAAMAAAGAPAYAWIPALADAIVEAMPSSWWKIPETCLDTFYTLEMGRSYRNQDGAARAVRLDLVPWLLVPRL